MYIAVADQGGGFRTQVFVGPNLCSHYEIRPESFLAKNNFSLELDAGVPSKVADTLDTTAIPTFLQGATELAGKAAGVAMASSEPLEAAVLDKGLYVWTGSDLVRFPQSGEISCS